MAAMVALHPRDGAALVSAFAMLAAAPLGSALNRLSDARLSAAKSFVGGASLAYVVVDLLVELAGAGAPLHGALPIAPTDDKSLFAVVLCGATAWYVAAALAPRVGGERGGYLAYAVPHGVYRVTVGGALALEAEEGIVRLVLFAIPMLLHLTAVESRFHHRFEREHHGLPRFALDVAPGLGALAWALFEIPDAALFIALAVVAGSTFVQIIQTELPSPELVRVRPFLLGVGVYSAMVVARWAA
jgi:hypothetical protein